MNEHSLLIEEYLTELEKQVEGDRFSREQYIQLFALFGDLLSRALILVDKKAVTLYTNNTKEVYVVTADKDRHIIRKDLNFCACQSFHYQVHQSGSEYTCKHVLACKLARILNRHQKSTASEEFIESLIQDFEVERSESVQ